MFNNHSDGNTQRNRWWYCAQVDMKEGKILDCEKKYANRDGGKKSIEKVKV